MTFSGEEVVVDNEKNTDERRYKREMKLFKKVSAVVASALMVGLTMGVAAAANYPAPFISGSTADVAIVYGADSPNAIDGVPAGNIETNLGTKLAGTTGATVTGESENLASNARKLYYGDDMNAADTSLGYSQLGTVLADEKFTDLSGTQYGYTQTVRIGPANMAFGTSGGDIDDPTTYIETSTTVTTDTLYNYTLSFNKNLNFSDSVNVQGQKLKLLGVEYVIGASSTNSTVYLYGSGETIKINGGEETTVTIAGTEHTVKLVTTADSTHGTLEVDGVSKSVTEGSNYAWAGGLNIYVKDVIHPAYAGDLRQAELILGANTLKLVNGQTVKIGADETSVKGTQVAITAGGDGIISTIAVQVAASDSEFDHIAAGESFKDPVFGGLKLTFAGTVPTLTSADRGQLIVTDDSQSAYVTFQRYGDEAKKIQYAYDNNTATSDVAPLLAGKTVNTQTGKGVYHVLEGENALEGDFLVLNQGDNGIMVEIEDISINTATEAKVKFTNVGDNTEYAEISLTNSSNTYSRTGVNMFGGTYNVYVDGSKTGNAMTVNVTWNTAGSRAVFPRIKLANGGWIAFLTQQKVMANSSFYILPDGATTLEGATGDPGTNYTYGTTSSNETDGIVWYLQNSTNTDGDGYIRFWALNGTVNYCNFNSSSGPALLYFEPKKWDDSTYGNYICVPMTKTGTSTVEIALDDPVFNGTNSGYITWTSDNTKKQALDKYGTLVTKVTPTSSSDRTVTLAFPESQMYYDVIFSSESASVTATGGALGNIVVLDSEVSSVSTKNLIVVGGSCVNTVAAELVGAGCTTEWTTNTGIGSGQFLIQSFTSPYSSSKVAVLVAGYEAADTSNAATYLTTSNNVDTTVGKKYKGTSSTAATLVVA